MNSNQYADDGTACGGAYNTCCLGNAAVVDPTASTLVNAPAGRCIMSSSFVSGPRRYCQHCLDHLHNRVHIGCDTRHQGQQLVHVASAIHATQRLDVRDRAILASPVAGAFASASSSGSIEVGVDAETGDLVGTGSAFLRNNATVHGSLQVGGTIDLQSGAIVVGSSAQGAPVGLPALPSLGGLTVPPSSAAIDLQPDTSDQVAPGVFDRINVKSRATLTLLPGTYRVRSFVLEPGASAVTVGQVALIVSQEWILRGTISSPTTLVYLGSGQLSFERPYVGTVLAPAAIAKITKDFAGTMIAGTLLLEPDAVFSCDESLAWNPSLLP